MCVLWKPSPLPRQRIRAAHTAHSKGPYADAFLYGGAIQKPMGIQGVSSPHIPPPAQKSHRQTACGIFDVMATPHNSARKLSERFCAGSKFRKRGNTVCISRFWNCGTGAKYPLRSADAIVRCCLRLPSL